MVRLLCHDFKTIHALAGTYEMQVPPPIAHLPTDDQVFISDGRGGRIPNAAFLKEHFLREGRLTENQALLILDQATKLLASEPNLVDVESPVTSKSPSFAIHHI